MEIAHSFQQTGPRQQYLWVSEEATPVGKKTPWPRPLLPPHRRCLFSLEFQFVASLPICRLEACFQHSNSADFGDTRLWRESRSPWESWRVLGLFAERRSCPVVYAQTPDFCLTATVDIGAMAFHAQIPHLAVFGVPNTNNESSTEKIGLA